MFRRVTLLILGASLIGCTSTSKRESEQQAATAAQDMNAQMAAYAASTQFPEGEASNDLRAAAVVDRTNNNLKIYNFSNQPLRDVNVWVNGSFVRKVSSIPAHGSVSIPRSVFFDASGQSLTAQDPMITSVQVADGDKLYNLQGPVME